MGLGCRITKYAGHFEFDVLNGGLDDLGRDIVMGAECVGDFVDQNLGRGRTGGDANRLNPVKRTPVDVCGTLHKLGIITACARTDLNQTFGVR